MKIKQIKIILLSLVVVVFFVYAINQYLEKQRYESYLSMQVENDFSRLSSSVINNEKMYNEILQSGTISLQEVMNLYHNNYEIVRIAQEYQNFAIDLRRLGRDEVNNSPSLNASDIAWFFQRLIWNIAEEEGIEQSIEQFPYALGREENYSLDEEFLEKITVVNELNKRWVHVIEIYVEGAKELSNANSDVYFDKYRDHAIKDDYWVDVVLQMDIETEEYLKEHNYYGGFGDYLRIQSH
ncbi:hypothetical protein J2T56_000115 [Natronobacillus azotifigens]|uniref:Uncharacterized protein n=1 Tax=Natronobacillus azotifigens TaxID=472978 RepID=A0A9J6R7T0_9BACI|nr:hypothetical protein [Natronobacillus azotifigens]MCZ0701677.1 hypothetical protein [Natronobacillus azotifigens]